MLRFVLPIVLLKVSCACTVWQVRGHGFAANLHNFYSIFPIFHGRNGTFYIDNRSNYYSCTASRGSENGWFDFFDPTDTKVLPWTAEEDVLKNNSCRIISFHDVRSILTHLKRDSVHMKILSVMKVCVVSIHCCRGRRAARPTLTLQLLSCSFGSLSQLFRSL
jgi:hypothetical protein